MRVSVFLSGALPGAAPLFVSMACKILEVSPLSVASSCEAKQKRALKVLKANAGAPQHVDEIQRRLQLIADPAAPKRQRKTSAAELFVDLTGASGKDWPALRSIRPGDTRRLAPELDAREREAKRRKLEAIDAQAKETRADCNECKGLRCVIITVFQGAAAGTMGGKAITRARHQCTMCGHEAVD